LDEKEILIPTASKLCDGGVKFSFTNHITSIGFDHGTTTFKLPNIKIDVNSEVIIRNLAAFEATSKFDESESESLVFTQYIELMNGIIETTKDVKVLRHHGILKTESLKDDEVVKIFSGMSKSVQLASTHELYKAIADVTTTIMVYERLRLANSPKVCIYLMECSHTFCCNLVRL